MSLRHEMMRSQKAIASSYRLAIGLLQAVRPPKKNKIKHPNLAETVQPASRFRVHVSFVLVDTYLGA